MFADSKDCVVRNPGEFLCPIGMLGVQKFEVVTSRAFRHHTNRWGTPFMLNALSGEGPLYQQVYRALRDSIVSGRMPKGSRLPATRILARELGVSRTTVLIAYEQLTAEGYAVARVGSGTYTAATLPNGLQKHLAQRPVSGPQSFKIRSHLSEYAKAIARLPINSDITLAVGRTHAQVPYDFQFVHASMEDFPFRVWKRLIAQRPTLKPTNYSLPEGNAELREAIANHLAVSRGVCCKPEQILIVNGTQQALDLASRLLLNPGDFAALEEPHYPGAWEAFHAVRARTLSIPVDESGLQVARLTGHKHRVRLLFLTPSHQVPTGVILSLDRRVQLLDWASRTGTYVIEDDYDGEYRYKGCPLESLQGLDRSERVLHIGSFSRALSPALRIGYMIVPQHLVRTFRAAKWITDRHTSMLQQEVLADFIRERHLEHYLRRLRTTNERRRAALLEAISRHFGEAAKVTGADSGVHVMLRIRGLNRHRIGDLVKRAAAAGVGVYTLTPYCVDPSSRNELLLGYGALKEYAIEQGIRILRTCVDH